VTRINARMVARGWSALVASAVLASGAGCTAHLYTEPAAGPTYVETAPPPAVAVSPPVDAEVVVDPEPPVVDIETYPSVVYEGFPVYYVGGRWYRRGPHGWAHYRQEPAELGRQRAVHEREPRWVHARDVPQRGQERVAPPPYRPGVAEPQAPDRRGPHEPLAPPQREETRVPVAPQHREETRAPVAPRRQEETKPEPAPKRAPAPVKRAPSRPVESTPRENQHR